MTAQDYYNMMVKEHVAPFMKLQGFKKSGTTWGLRGSELWGVISLWRSDESTKSRVNFSITLGVSFDQLNESRGFTLPPTRIPSSGHMHWHEHLETLPAKERRQAKMRFTNKDHEWHISHASDVEPLGAEVVNAMQKVAIPAIRRRRSIDAFLDEYDATGRNPIGADMNYALAELMLLRHRRKDAERLLVEEVRTSVGHPSYENLLEGIGTLGLNAAAIERAALKPRGRKGQ